MTSEFEKLCATTGRLAADFVDVSVALIDYLTPALKTIAAVVDNLKIVMLAKECPNRHVAHLALHGKKSRVRKKNIKRLKEYAEREGI